MSTPATKIIGSRQMARRFLFNEEFGARKIPGDIKNVDNLPRGYRRNIARAHAARRFRQMRGIK